MLCSTIFYLMQYSFWSQHLDSEGHLIHAQDPSKFKRIDDIGARHRIERAVAEEVSHHVLKLLMLKHPEKFAELDWIFPKLARWVALLRQAEKNVAERDRLAAEAAETAPVSNPDTDHKLHSATLKPSLFDHQKSPLPSSSSASMVLDPNAIVQLDSCSSSNSNASAPIRSNECMRLFNPAISLTDTLSGDASQSRDESSNHPTRFSQFFSQAAVCTRSDACTGSVGPDLAASSTLGSRTIPMSISSSGFENKTEAATLTKDSNSFKHETIKTLARNCEAVFAKPVARVNRKERSSIQLGDTLPSNPSVSSVHIAEPANDSLNQSHAQNLKSLSSTSTLEMEADAFLRRDFETGAATSLHSLPRSSADPPSISPNSMAIAVIFDLIACTRETSYQIAQFWVCLQFPPHVSN
jgi:hypothetical protein